MTAYSLTIRNRVVALVVALLVLGLGAALVVLGFALLASLAVAGGVLATGVAIYRRLAGRGPQPLEGGRARQLDPSLEVFPDRPSITSAPRKSSSGERGAGSGERE